MTSPQPERAADPQNDPEASQEYLVQTPIPKLPLLSVCVARIAEPLAYTQIFPYVNQMAWDLGVTDNPKKVGFYSGMIDSAFAFAQMFTVYGYGTLSDHIGRKPVVLLGTLGVALSAVLFGLSDSFTHMMVTRTIAGLLSGYVAVLHSVMGEITDDTNQAAAYPIYSLCYPIGSLIGPLIGGTLAQPNQNIPHLVPPFLRNVFDNYPYMLPSLVACAVAIVSSIFVMVFMNETLPSKIRKKSLSSSGTSTPSSVYGTRGRTIECGSGRNEGSNATSPTITERSRRSSTSTRVGEIPKKCPSETDALLRDEEEVTHKWTAWELLKLPKLRQLYRSSAVLSFIAESHVVVFVLFAYTKVEYGGLDFDPAKIGFVLAFSGGISFSLQILILPIILRRFKPTWIFEKCMALWPVGYAIPPILNFIARISSDNGKHPIGNSALVVIWMGIWFTQLLTKFACMAYPMNMIIARQSAPDQRALGATNGLNQLSFCASRMLAPVSVSTLFVLSTEHNWMGGYFVWMVMVTLSVMGWKVSGYD